MATGFVALLLATTAAVGMAAEVTDDELVVGRYSVVSDAGGAIWAFQPGGLLFVTGPGDLVAEGTWTSGPEAREFDADVDVTITGQTLNAIGEVSADGRELAMYVISTDPTKPNDGVPWPADSRLIGEVFGMATDPTPEPSEPPADCLRPMWVDGAVDWDRCDATLLTQP